MKNKKEIINKINTGNFDSDIYDFLLLDVIKNLKEKIFQRFYREKTKSSDKKFAEFVLIETTRSICSNEVAPFYFFMRGHTELRKILDLKHLKTLSQYLDYNKKRKNLKFDFNNIIKRNLKVKTEEIYLLDTTIIKTDINAYKKAKKIKKGHYDIENLFSKSKGFVSGFEVAVLINFSNMSIKKVVFYSKTTKKKQIWKEMVLEELGTDIGKLKVVIADAGFFAYDNYTFAPNYRIIPIIKPKKRYENKITDKLNNLSPNIFWFSSKYNKHLDTLLEDFKTIITETINGMKSYKEDFAKTRSNIEILFKVAKYLFGMENIHCYYRDFAVWKISVILYVSSLFYQFCLIEGINEHRLIEFLKYRHRKF